MNYIEQNRDFKGVWIPKEIWLNDELTMIEKVILIEIDSLDNEDHCIAGNEYLAAFCQCSEWKVSTAIKKLQELGYIEIVSFDGRHRKIKSRLWKTTEQPLENPKADLAKPQAINKEINKEINLDINNAEETDSKESEAKASSTKDSKSKDSSVEKEKNNKGRKSLKDQLVEYVNSLDYKDETKEILFKWIFTIGLNRNVKLGQLQDMLKSLWEQCKDESLVRECINKSYLNNWFGFYPPKPPYNAPFTPQPVKQPISEPQPKEVRLHPTEIF